MRSSMVSMESWVKGAFAQAVAGAVKADDEAVADQHVVAHAFDIDRSLTRLKAKACIGVSIRTAAVMPATARLNKERLLAHERFLLSRFLPPEGVARTVPWIAQK